MTRRGHPFRVEQLSSFGEDSDGELYALSQDGSVYQFVKAPLGRLGRPAEPAAPPPV